MVLELELAVEQGLELLEQPVQVQVQRLELQELLVPAVELVQVQQEQQVQRLEQEQRLEQAQRLE